MPVNRLEILQQMLEQDPRNTFARYGVAMERKNAGELQEAVVEFRRLIETDPNYVAAYFHGGQTLEKLGAIDEAREMYRRGVAIATDEHARSEMAAALEMLG